VSKKGRKTANTPQKSSQTGHLACISGISQIFSFVARAGDLAKMRPKSAKCSEMFL
jgi:hypothetical protein